MERVSLSGRLAKLLGKVYRSKVLSPRGALELSALVPRDKEETPDAGGVRVLSFLASVTRGGDVGALGGTRGTRSAEELRRVTGRREIPGMDIYVYVVTSSAIGRKRTEEVTASFAYFRTDANTNAVCNKDQRARERPWG